MWNTKRNAAAVNRKRGGNVRECAVCQDKMSRKVNVKILCMLKKNIMHMKENLDLLQNCVTMQFFFHA